MSGTGHTPGPWRYLEDHDGDAACSPLTVCDSDSNDLASIYSRDDATVDIPREQAIANARLIAAAPELLARLVEIRKCMDFDPWDAKFIAEIDTLIAAAKGGAA